MSSPATATPAAATPAIPAATTAPTAASTAKSEPLPTNPEGTLGKEGFLKLMVAQLQAQNPLQPTEGSEYISELAQFTQLEQVTNLAQTASQSASAQQVAQSVALIGHTVSYTDPTTGAVAQGTVQNVEITSSGATLTVEGHTGIEPASITEVS